MECQKWKILCSNPIVQTRKKVKKRPEIQILRRIQCLMPSTEIGRKVVSGLRQSLAIQANEECDTRAMTSCSVYIVRRENLSSVVVADDRDRESWIKED